MGAEPASPLSALHHPWGFLLEQPEPKRDGCGSVLAIMRSEIAVPILPGMAFFGSIASSTVVAWINALRVGVLT